MGGKNPVNHDSLEDIEADEYEAVSFMAASNQSR